MGECFSRVISQTVNALSLSDAPLLNRKGSCMPKTPRKPAATDWERVQREATQELPISHSATDGLYDPINAALREAVAHGLTKA
jgi:hypothetical protein